MRFKFQFELENNLVTLDYRRKVMSFIKRSLDNYNKEIFKLYYEEPNLKDFCFSTYFPIEKFEKGKMVLKENYFSVIVSIDDVLGAMHFYNAFLGMKNKKVPFDNNNKCKLTFFRKLVEKEIKSDVAIFKTLSPILIREHMREGNKNWYYLLNEKKGLEILKKNLLYILSSRFKKEDIEKIEIIPIEIKKTVVSFYDMQFPASRGIFAIKANKEILNYFYKVGFGSRASAGFGLLELVK